MKLLSYRFFILLFLFSPRIISDDIEENRKNFESSRKLNDLKNYARRKYIFFKDFFARRYVNRAKSLDPAITKALSKTNLQDLDFTHLKNLQDKLKTAIEKDSKLSWIDRNSQVTKDLNNLHKEVTKNYNKRIEDHEKNKPINTPASTQPENLDTSTGTIVP